MKRLLVMAVVLSSMGLKAQVGINTTDPKSSLEVAYDDAQSNKVQAIGLPHVTTSQRNDFKYEDLKDGQMIYNMTSKCVEVCIGKTWKCLSSTEGGLPQPVDPEGSATFGALSNIEEGIVSFKYGNQPSDKIQGRITAAKIPVQIPYTGATAGTVVEKIIEAEGNPHLKLKIKSATISAGNGALNAEIYYTGTGDYDLPLVTLQQINAGNYKQPTDVVFKVNVKGATNPATVKVNALGGIPDRKFNEGDEHKFLYLPITVTGPGYSETWLNMNLGAEMARVGSSYFNPTIKKYGTTGVHDDENLYGSYYQWQRPSDGHEFKNSGTTSTQASNWQATLPYEVRGKFITGSYNWMKWGSSVDDDYGDAKLWQANGNTNPCPVGYHVPTEKEWGLLHKAVTGTESATETGAMWNQTLLPNLPAAGRRFGESATLIEEGERGGYWSSRSSAPDGGVMLTIRQDESDPGYPAYRWSGRTIRCLKD